MNCVNCNSRLFLFNETEELYPGSELVFCSSCRKKIAPFLEDPNRYPTHAEHLDKVTFLRHWGSPMVRR